MARPEDIAKMNPWWSLGASFEANDKDLAKLTSGPFRFERRRLDLKPGNIYIIKGPRRTGKTVFLKNLVLELLKNGVDRLSIFYYSLDSVKSANELNNMLRDFFGNLGTGTRYVLLDEAQNVEGWENVIQALANEGLLKNTVTIVTGSLAHVLRQELMPGRGTEGNTYLMRPISFGAFCTGLLWVFGTSRKGTNSFDLKGSLERLIVLTKSQDVRSLISLLGDETGYARELLQALGNHISLEESLDEIYAKAYALVPYANLLKKLFNVYMHTGGYPSSINSFFQESLPSKPSFQIAQQVFEELYLYAKNDAATLSGAGKSGNPAFAETVLKSTLEHVGMGISYTKLSELALMNTKTFIEYSERLRESYVFLALNGLDKELKPIRLKKVYFTDPLLHYSVGSADTGEEPNKYADAVLNSEAAGIVAEEIVASHIAQTKEDEPMRRYDTYLNFLKGKREIDFVYKRNNGNYVGIEVKYQNSVHAENDLYMVDTIKDYILLSKDTMEKGEHYIVLPVYLFLATLERSQKDL